MTDQTKQKLKYWLIGLFSGSAVAVPVTALVTKKICDNKSKEVVQTEYKKGYDSGINDMAAYAVKQQYTNDKVYTEEDYAAKTDPEDINKISVIEDYEEEDAEAAQGNAEAHDRYLDMIDKYNNNEIIPPRIISGEQFSNEHYMQKSYINWYEQDNVFEEGLDVIEDPYSNFGVTDGHELFRLRLNETWRPDPDICYVRNEKYSTDYEITRIHGSYAVMVRGEKSLGETDS